MRLLVTGASGFIGRNLLLRLPREWEVVVTYNKSVDFTRFPSENLLENVEAIKVDLTDAIETKKKLRLKFDCTVHLAANTDTLFSVENPERDLQLNVVTLLNIAKNVKTEDLIFMSSGAVYDGNEGLVSPAHRLKPSFPYAISKLACERYVDFFKKSEAINSYVVLRFFGAYGPHEPPRKIFTKLVKAFYFEKSEEFVIVGDGNNFIDAMYVEDAVYGSKEEGPYSAEHRAGTGSGSRSLCAGDAHAYTDTLSPVGRHPHARGPATVRRWLAGRLQAGHKRGCRCAVCPPGMAC